MAIENFLALFFFLKKDPSNPWIIGYEKKDTRISQGVSNFSILFMSIDLQWAPVAGAIV